MPKDEQLVYALLCLAALVVYFIVIPVQIQEPDWVSVSPALLPRICCGLIFLFCLLRLIGSFRQPRTEALIKPLHYARLMVVLAVLIATTFAMFYFGFWIPVAAMVVVLLLIADQRNPVSIAVYTLALVGCSWYLLDLAGLYIIEPY